MKSQSCECTHWVLLLPPKLLYQDQQQLRRRLVTVGKAILGGLFAVAEALEAVEATVLFKCNGESTLIESGRWVSITASVLKSALSQQSAFLPHHQCTHQPTHLLSAPPPPLSVCLLCTRSPCHPFLPAIFPLHSWSMIL